MQDNPFFSIIIPTYNRKAFIADTVKSVLQQSFADFEIIVVDDGGTDDTENILLDLKSSKIQYFKKINEERGAARNFGWEKSKGMYVSFLDSDDKLYPNHLLEAYNILNEKNYSCYAQAYEIRNAETNRLIFGPYVAKSPQINKQIVKQNFLSCFGVFLRRDLIFDVKFEEERKFAGTEDWLLWLRLAARYPFYYNNLVTGTMLQHKNRSVLSFNEESLAFRAKFLNEALLKDIFFVNKFGNQTIKRILAHMLTYASLHLAFSQNKSRSFYYLLKALKTDYKEILQRRTLGIIKNNLLSHKVLKNVFSRC